jgi:uncharacterized membrane protein SpoIIM required for sporulation
MEMRQNADVLVIGAGQAGLAMGYYLVLPLLARKIGYRREFQTNDFLFRLFGISVKSLSFLRHKKSPPK